MFTKAVQYFYPDIKTHEVKKFGFLSLAFVFTIGTYWLMRLLKDVILYKLAFPVTLGWQQDTGRLWIPTLKTISPLFVLLLLVIYSKLVDLFEKHKLMYVIVSFYMVVFSILTGVLFIKYVHGEAHLGRAVLAGSGILGYLLTESFGSLVVALFWSFTISCCTSDQARRAFPFIVASGQFGAIGGSSLMLISTTIIWPFYALVVLFLGCFIVTVYLLVNTVSATDMQGEHVAEKHAKHNVLSGLKLLLTKPYLMGVFIVSTFYEIASTIVEYQMNSQASLIFDDATFKWFKGIYGVSINLLAFFIALLGTSYVIKRFGTRICLLIYPVAFALSLVGLYYFYALAQPTAFHLLWATFGVMLIVKATAYAVNNPVKEMMYIPTSKDAKFKTKGIIDMFGSRFAKMSGAQTGGWLNVTGNPSLSIHNLMTYGSLISLGVIGLWIAAAIFVGTQNQKLVEDGKIVE